MSSSATYIIYGICVLLFILFLLFFINFINHFQFYFKCPYVIRDTDVGGIYPTLILMYIAISFLILSIIMILISYNHPSDMYLSHPFCKATFSLYTDFTFMDKSNNNTSFALYLLISFLFYIILILETYFSFSRYYNVCDIQHKYPLSTCFIIYCIIFLICIWLSITIFPIITIFLCIQHICIITYFSYYFHLSISASYHHVFTTQLDHTDTYNTMISQIRQIRQMSILSVISSIITAISWYSFILCSNNKQIQILPLTLTINCIFLFTMFSKNRAFIHNIIHCKCNNISSALRNVCSLYCERRKQRQWIRDRQKSIFNRIQRGLSAPAILAPRNSTNTIPIMANEGDDPRDQSSIEVRDDIDPMNTILHNENANKRVSLSNNKQSKRNSLSIQSDISDIFVKMKSIGQTFRHNRRRSDLDLVRELELQVQRQQKEIKVDERKVDIETLKKDATILKLREKTNRQISFGADMALEIIKETIDLQTQEIETEPTKLKLSQNKSEPTLMSGYIYEDESIVCDHSVINISQDIEDSLPITRSKTCPNSPNIKKMKHMTLNQIKTKSNPINNKDRMHNNNYNNDNNYNNNDNNDDNNDNNDDDDNDDNDDIEIIKRKKRVFLYNNDVSELNNPNPLELNKSLSENIQMPRSRERVFSTSEMVETPSTDIDGFHISFDYFNQKQNDLQTPLSPSKHAVSVNSERDPYGSLNTEKETVLNTERSKTKSKSILGSFRSILKRNKHQRDKSGSNITKIHSFLEFNGLTMRHQNVNHIFNNQRSDLRGPIPEY